MGRSTDASDFFGLNYLPGNQAVGGAGGVIQPRKTKAKQPIGKAARNAQTSNATNRSRQMRKQNG